MISVGFILYEKAAYERRTGKSWHHGGGRHVGWDYTAYYWWIAKTKGEPE